MSLLDSMSVTPTEQPPRFGAKSLELLADSTSRTGQMRLHLAGKLAIAIVLVDLCAITMGFGLGLAIAEGLRVHFGVGQVEAGFFLAERARELALLAILAICIFAFGGLYRRASWEMDEVRRIVAGVGLVALFDAALQFILRDHSSRLWFLAAYPMIALMVISLRMGVRTLPAIREAMTSHVILLGTGIAPDRMIYQLRGSRSGPVKLLHALPLARIAGRDPETLDHMIERLARHAGVASHRIQTVLAPSPEELAGTQTTLELMNATQRSYSIVLPFTGLARNGLGLQKVVGADMVMAEMHPVRVPFLARGIKRLFDLIVTSLVLVLLAPVLLILTVLLAFEGGPIFFSQIRVGRDGQRFRCYKFRSMRPDAEARLLDLLASDPKARAEWETHQKLTDDPRITPIGDFLRKTSLDELPQLINVLKGEMSLIGPRPIVAPEIDGYPSDRAYAENPGFGYYTQCMPGITGLWQVLGRASTSHDERIRLDRWYARNWSFWLDCVILFKTFRAVLDRNGSG